MKSSPFARIFASLIAASVAYLPTKAAACAACMGDVNSKFAPATNDAIFLMLGVIGCMLATILGCAFCLYKRSKSLLPPHDEVAHTMTPEGPRSFPESV
jgi:hypothetical protein